MYYEAIYKQEQIERDSKTFGNAVIVLSFISLLFWCVAYFFNEYAFNRDVGDYLKRAADANTVDIALSQLKIAIQKIESKNYTSGTTAVFLDKPSNDLGFWYKNIKAAHDGLDKLPKSDLERTEVVNTSLLKLRQTLLDQSSGTEKVTVPPGIAQFPNNAAMAIWGWTSLIICCIFVFFVYFFGDLVQSL